MLKMLKIKDIINRFLTKVKDIACLFLTKVKDMSVHVSYLKRLLCLIREKVVTFRMVKLNLLLSIFCITK